MSPPSLSLEHFLPPPSLGGWFSSVTFQVKFQLQKELPRPLCLEQKQGRMTQMTHFKCCLSPCFLCLFHWNVVFLVPTAGCLPNPHSLLSLSQYNPNLFTPPTSSGPIPEVGDGSSHLSPPQWSHFLPSVWLGHEHVTHFCSVTHDKSPGEPLAKGF